MKINFDYEMNRYSFRDEVKNNLPILMIIFSLIKTNFLRNNGLFKRNSTQSKGNRIIKMGRLFFTSSLTPSHTNYSIFLKLSTLKTAAQLYLF